MKITLDQFFEEFKPQLNHIVRKQTVQDIKDEDICPYNGTMYETYGPEEDYINLMAKMTDTQNRVWTLVDVDGELVITAGWAYVNRMGYFVTKEPWTDINTEVECEEEL